MILGASDESLLPALAEAEYVVKLTAGPGFFDSRSSRRRQIKCDR